MDIIEIVLASIGPIVAIIGLILRFTENKKLSKTFIIIGVFLSLISIPINIKVSEQRENENSASSHIGTLQSNSQSEEFFGIPVSYIGLFNEDSENIVYPKVCLGGTICGQGGPQGITALSQGEDRIFVWVENGKLKLNAKVRDENGNIMGEITNNDFESFPNYVLKSNHDNNGWEVIDPRGRVALQVDMIDQTVNIYGVFYSEDGTSAPVFFNGGMDPIMGPKEMVKKFVDQKWRDNPNLIAPIFVYPSDLHPGERVKNNHN